MPYIALMSISKSSKIYWAKGFPQNLGNKIGAIKLSSDGLHLIAHSYSHIDENFIVAMKVATG
jgi:hypothetical protein